MKKLVALVVVLLLSITLTACGNVQNKAESTVQPETSSNTNSDQILRGLLMHSVKTT